MDLAKLQEDLKQAQLNKDETRVSTLRLLLSEIKNSEITKGEQLSKQEIIAVIAKEVKKRKEAATGFRQGGREEAAVKEEQEADILSNYLPAQLSDEELSKIVDEAIKETGASSMPEMGKVIGVVMAKVAGQAEGGRVSMLVKEKLASSA